ncbi:MAG: hypothetical protein IJI24_04130 [Lachnospiraceae bacterium]|nr:hypothetical protein [Lachnospiraceae bacterium]
MKLTYVVTEDTYAEAIRYQRQLQNRQPGQQLRFWGMNLIFLGAAVWFFFARTQYAPTLRLAPLLMAVVLFALSFWRRSSSPARVRGILKRYQSQGMLADGFIGEHTLLVEHGKIRRKAGKSWQDADASAFGALQDLDQTTLLIAGGVILDTIPRKILDQGGNREKLLAAIRREGRGTEEGEISSGSSSGGEQTEEERLEMLRRAGLAEEPVRMAYWKVDQATYVRGMVEGHRRYYSTVPAWRGSQMVRALLFVYGVIMFISRQNMYIGAAFMLIGLLLNRQLLITFSPLSYRVVNNQYTGIAGDGSEGEEEIFYRTKGRIGAVFLGQHQYTRNEEVAARRSAPGFTFLYSRSGQMYVLPDQAFSGNAQKEEFLKGLPDGRARKR